VLQNFFQIVIKKEGRRITMPIVTLLQKQAVSLSQHLQDAYSKNAIILSNQSAFPELNKFTNLMKKHGTIIFRSFLAINN